jgi:hypothetical protein
MPKTERSHDYHKPILAYIIDNNGKDFRVVHHVIYYLNENFEVRHNEDGDITSKTYRWEDWYSGEVVKGVVGWTYLEKDFFDKAEDDIRGA